MTGLGAMPVVVIGAVLGREGSLDFSNRRAEALEHVRDDVVAADQDAGLVQLGGEVAIAQVPSEADQMRAIPAANLVKRFIGGKDTGKTPVFEFERVAMSQGNGRWKIEENFIAAPQAKDLAADASFIGLKDNCVVGRRADIGGGYVADNAEHQGP